MTPGPDVTRVFRFADPRAAPLPRFRTRDTEREGRDTRPTGPLQAAQNETTTASSRNKRRGPQ